MSDKAKLYFSGVPRDPDIRKLVETFGTPVIGTQVTYAEVEQCLGISWRTKRFAGVTWAWREKLFRDNNLVLKPIPGTAFEVQDSRGRLDITGKLLNKGIKTIGKSHKVGASTPRKGLNPEENRTLDHHVRVSATLLHAHRTAPKDLGEIPSLAPQLSTR